MRAPAGKSITPLLKDLSAVPVAIRTAVRNRGGGHANHSLFWQLLKRHGGGRPTGELSTAIDLQFGSFPGFRKKFTDVAMNQFGSGRAWLTLDAGRPHAAAGD